MKMSIRSAKMAPIKFAYFSNQSETCFIASHLCFKFSSAFASPFFRSLRPMEAIPEAEEEPEVTPPTDDAADDYEPDYEPGWGGACAVTAITGYEAALKDVSSVLSFRRAILDHPFLYEGKTILDLTPSSLGVYSFFCVRAGARHVYTTHPCSLSARTVREIAARNGFTADEITVLQGEIGACSLPEKVDVLLGDWMGDCLFSRSTLPEFLQAKDRFLKPGGFILPNQFSLGLCAITDPLGKASSIDYWDTQIYDFNMECIREGALREAEHYFVHPSQVLTNMAPLQSYDLETLDRESLRKGERVSFELKVHRRATMHAFCCYFVAEFTHCFAYRRSAFSTSPLAPNTKWKQSIFYTDIDLDVIEGATFTGHFSLDVNDVENVRDVVVVIEWTYKDVNMRRRATNVYNLK